MTTYEVNQLPSAATSRAPLLVGVIVAAVIIAAGTWFFTSRDSGTSTVTTTPSTSDKPTPTQTSDAPPSPLYASGDGFSCFAEDSSITCMGVNGYGELGVEDKEIRSNTFTLGGTVENLVAGDNFACASTGKGVACWGDNRWRQANNSDQKRVVPTVLDELKGKKVTSISAGANFACAIADGGIMCWGADNAGQLGRGAEGMNSNPPQVVSLPDGAKPVNLYSNDFTTLVKTESGDWFAFGSNVDSRINNKEASSLPPTKIE